MMWLRRVIPVLWLTLLTLMLLTVPVLAIADPDSPPQIRSVFSYYDLLEDGDRGFLIDYYLDYDTSGLPPTGETATESYMAILIGVDGITQIRAVAPYTFVDSGYGRGLMWIYFNPADATAYITPGGAHLVWLVGNPALSWTPGPDPPKSIAAIDYWQPAGTSAASLLASRVLYLADQLELEWTGVDLIESTSLGERLTTIGENYFGNVIANLRTMAPDAFSAGTMEPIRDPDVHEFGTSWAQKLVTDVIGTPLDVTALATAFGMSRGALSGLLWLVGMGVVLYFAVMYLGTKIAVIFLDLLIVAGGLFGMLPWALVIGLGVLALMLTGFMLFYKPSGA